MWRLTSVTRKIGSCSQSEAVGASGRYPSFPLRQPSRKEAAAVWRLPPPPRPAAWALCPAEKEDADAAKDEAASVAVV